MGSNKLMSSSTTRWSMKIACRSPVPTQRWNMPANAAANHLLSNGTFRFGWLSSHIPGKRVLRLKGGDPFVFGRGGEEALTLVEHDVPFRIVPGITAGIGGLAYAGIPVTHRETNQSVTFLTGHDATGLVPDSMDWNSIAKGSSVIVMYMAMKHIGLIASRLIGAGRSKDEPIAFRL